MNRFVFDVETEPLCKEEDLSLYWQEKVQKAGSILLVPELTKIRAFGWKIFVEGKKDETCIQYVAKEDVIVQVPGVKVAVVSNERKLLASIATMIDWAYSYKTPLVGFHITGYDIPVIREAGIRHDYGLPFIESKPWETAIIDLMAPKKYTAAGGSLKGLCELYNIDKGWGDGGDIEEMGDQEMCEYLAKDVINTDKLLLKYRKVGYVR